MSGARFSTPAVDAAVARETGAPPAPFLQVGPVIEVYFPVADSPVDVAHQLGVIPTGFVCLLQLGGRVDATLLTEWTDTRAWLTANGAHTRARVYFVETKEPIRNAHI